MSETPKRKYERKPTTHRMFGEPKDKKGPAEVPPTQRARQGIKTLRREEEEPFPDIPSEHKDKIWMWLRNWKLTCRKLNWSDYSIGRLLDNLEESYREPPSVAMVKTVINVDVPPSPVVAPPPPN